jgi:hypothetical protein
MPSKKYVEGSGTTVRLATPNPAEFPSKLPGVAGRIKVASAVKKFKA